MTTSLIGFIGGGNMARSLIGGLIQRGHLATRLLASEPQAASREALARDFGIGVSADNAEVAARADVLVMATKPQVLKTVCQALAPTLAGRAPLILSIAAGVRIAQFEQWLGAHLPIVRAMPNTPALIGAGISGLIGNARVGASQRDEAERIARAAGEAVWIPDESLMDAVTAVSGSGPAYFFLLIEALQAAAVRQGLPETVARDLVLATAVGAARMARESGEPASTLRERVTSPGGTTQAALEVFEQGGLRALVDRAIARATERGGELSRALGQD